MLSIFTISKLEKISPFMNFFPFSFSFISLSPQPQIFPIFPKIQISSKIPTPHNLTNLHLMHLSLSLPWPAKWPRRGTPIPLLFAKTPFTTILLHLLHKIPIIFKLFLYILLLFFSTSTKEKALTNSLFLLNLNPNSKNTTRSSPLAQATDLELGS